MNYITLSYWDLVIAALLIGVNAALSIRLRLSLERQLLIAASRMVVQLGLLGLVLKVLFETVSLPFTAAAALVMI
ncbi:MAG: ABC transporter permease, partial [Alphaproteobacteria bacterium]